LFGDNPPTIHYVRCDRPLVDEADRLKREVWRLSIDYLICDSIAPACDGPPEAAEVATAYFRSLRQIGVGTERVLWPVIFIAIVSGTPARFKLRTAVRRKSCGTRLGQPASVVGALHRF
jgi:hypothetical protein